MVQRVIFTDIEEDEIIEKYSKLWRLNKMETIKKIIKTFDKVRNSHEKA